MTEASPRKILIISADIGAGHDMPARAIAREFRQEDPQALIAVVNGLPVMGVVATLLLRENSAFLFRWSPWLFEFQYRLVMDFPPTRWLARRLLAAFSRKGLSRLIRAHDPDLIVSTYPGTTQVLGELRRNGALHVPVYASITDLAGLRYWAHPGVDLHLITHPESREEVERIAGPGSVRWVKPPTSPAFFEPRDRAQSRRVLDLPQDRPVIAVSGGGWGVGDMAGAIRTALEVKDAEVLCLCGYNERLRGRLSRQFGGEQRVRILGFTDRMSEVMAAADVLVHSTVGLTVLEAIIRGCPVISYGFGYGHVRVSNQALKRFGLASVARNQAQLRLEIDRALRERPAPDNSYSRQPSTAAVIRSSTRRTRPLPRWRVRTVRTLAAGGVTALLALWTFTAGMAYSVITNVAARPVEAVATPSRVVGVMVEAGPLQTRTLARDLQSTGMHVSFTLGRSDINFASSVIHAGDQPILQISDSGVFGWISTDHRLDRLRLHQLERELHWGNHFLYTSTGPSLAQFLIANGMGGRLVVGKVHLNRPGVLPRTVQQGEVIELRVTSLRLAYGELRSLAERLSDQHLSAVPVSTLLKDAGTPV
ncbi:MAG: MGDG synthase family glycosyltransferase [Solirubrobacteraceae bacterium]